MEHVGYVNMDIFTTYAILYALAKLTFLGTLQKPAFKPIFMQLLVE
jgi:hypothetical protein